MSNTGITRIGVCSWSLRPATRQELIEALKLHEINSVQLALGPILENPSVWGEVIEELRLADIQIASGMMATNGEDFMSLLIPDRAVRAPVFLWLQVTEDVVKVFAAWALLGLAHHCWAAPEAQADVEIHGDNPLTAN